MKVHALTKLFIVICITTGSLLHQNVVILIELLLISMMLNVFNANASEDWTRLFMKVFKLIPVFISIFLIQLLFDNSGHVIFHLWIIRITSHGVSTAVQVMLRLLIIVFSAGYLMKLGLREFLFAFRIVRLPESFAVMTALTIGFIPLLAGQIKQSLQQIRLRGIGISELSLRKRVELYLSLIMPILGRTVSNAKYLAITLELRGFRNGGKHTNYRKVNLQAFDYVLITTSLFLLVWSVL